MRLSRWMMLIAFLVGFGCLQVAQRTAMVLKGYAVGERMRRVHAQENEVAWLNVRVTGLGSPSRLAQAQEDRQLRLVAWSRLSPGPALVRVGPGPIPPFVSSVASEPAVIHVASNNQDTLD